MARAEESAKILVVGSDTAIVNDLHERTERLGHEVVDELSSSEKAIQRCERDRPDLVLMLVTKGTEMAGMAAAEVIRSRFGIPTVYIFSQADQTTLSSAKPLLPLGVLAEPFEDRDLGKAVDAALSAAAADRERRRAEEVTASSEERYRTLFEDSPISLWEEDFSAVKRHVDRLRAAGVSDFRRHFNEHRDELASCAQMVRIIAVNNATLQLYEASDLTDFMNNLETVFAEETYDAFLEEVLAIAEGRRVLQLDAVNNTVTGKLKHIRLKWSVAPGAEESLERVFISIVDISDRKRVEVELRQSEAALRESERNYRLLFREMSAGCALNEVLLDEQGRVRDLRFLEVNPAFAELVGRRAAEVVGRTVCEVLPETDEDWIERWGSVALSGKPVRFEGWHDPLGKYLDVAAYSPQEGLVATMLTDVTDRLKLQERLRHSEKMEAIGKLAGGVAHDFNNQLAAILVCGEMLVGQLADPRQRGHAETILRAAERSADLTRQLLAFARKGQYQAVVVDVHPVINEVVALLKHSIDRRINIIQKLRANPSTIRADPSQLENALLNLGLNARDAMPSGGELIFDTDVVDVDETSSTEQAGDPAPGQYLQVTVSDSGCGMDEQTRKQIFEPFFTTKDPGESTGMGLAAVYGTVRSHGGAIEVRSRSGHGTVFTLLFPILGGDQRQSDVGSAAQQTIPCSRILVVDDEELVCEALDDMLTAFGHQVVICHDGDEAVTYYRSHFREIDLVILDMIMPKMNGRDTFRTMRAINPQVRALLSTGYSIEGEAQQMLDEGVRGVLQKPYGSQRLQEALQEVFEGP